jgi:GNAT superfamily N-acetyltransferase
MLNSSPLSLRLMTTDDRRFVHSSWFMSFAKASSNLHMKREMFDMSMDNRIERLLARSRTLVAYSTDVPDEILGYVVLEGRTLHMCYVKPMYRGMGIGSGLVKGQADWYTHHFGRAGERFAEKMNLDYNPFQLES